MPPTAHADRLRILLSFSCTHRCQHRGQVSYSSHTVSQVHSRQDIGQSRRANDTKSHGDTIPSMACHSPGTGGSRAHTSHLTLSSNMGSLTSFQTGGDSSWHGCTKVQYGLFPTGNPGACSCAPGALTAGQEGSPPHGELQCGDFNLHLGSVLAFLSAVFTRSWCWTCKRTSWAETVTQYREASQGHGVRPDWGAGLPSLRKVHADVPHVAAAQGHAAL